MCSYRLDYGSRIGPYQQCGDRQGGDGDGDKVRDGWGLWEYTRPMLRAAHRSSEQGRVAVVGLAQQHRLRGAGHRELHRIGGRLGDVPPAW